MQWYATLQAGCVIEKYPGAHDKGGKLHRQVMMCGVDGLDAKAVELPAMVLEFPTSGCRGVTTDMQNTKASKESVGW